MTAVLPWRPLGAHNTLRTPQAGDLLAHDYAAWKVIGTRDQPVERWAPADHAMVRTYGPTAAARVVTLRRIHTVNNPGLPTPRNHGNVSLASNTKREEHTLDLRFWPGHTQWWIYPDRHYPVCAHCQQPQPCRQQDTDRIAAAMFARAERYSNPDHCPNCGDPVPTGSRYIRFAQNLYWPNGQPVVFHRGRRDCAIAADRYAQQLATTPHHH